MGGLFSKFVVCSEGCRNMNKVWETIKYFLGMVGEFLPLAKSDWQVDWQKVSSFDYLTQEGAGSGFRYYSQFGILFAVLLIISVFFFLKKRKVRNNPPRGKLYKQIFIYFLTFALSGLVLLFLRYEHISYLSSRIIFLLTLFVFMVWGLRLVYRYWKKFPITERDYRAYLLKQKYMPKRKLKVQNSKFKTTNG